jgi:hypothetical protein
MKIISYNENFELIIHLSPDSYHDGDKSLDRFSKSLTENGFRFTRRKSVVKHTFIIITSVKTVEVINRLLNDL